MAGAKRFNFFIDQKITAYERTTFEIIAKNKEDAEAQAKEVFEGILNFPDGNCIELMTETNEELSPEDNGGHSTKVLFSNDGNQLAQNGKD